MKKWWSFVILGVVAIVVAGGVVWWASRQNNVVEEFSLSEENYGEAATPEMTAAEFADLVTEKQSFIVVVHMMLCPAELPLKEMAKRLAQEENLRIYLMDENEFAGTELGGRIKYLPTMVVIREGEVVDFLDAEADEDVPAYQTVEGLREWLGSVGVRLRTSSN